MCCFGVPNKEIKEWKKLYIIWKGIVDRCYNENNDNYSYYGGKGVRLSKRIEESDFMPFIEHCALSILQDCDWQDLSTLLEERLQYRDYFEEMWESFKYNCPQSLA